MNTLENESISIANPVDELARILLVPPEQAVFLLSVLATSGRIVLVDEACRDIRPLIAFLSHLTGSEFQSKYCSVNTQVAEIHTDCPVVLERVEALSPSEQSRLAEKLLFDKDSCLLVATVNSRTEAENLSEDLRAAIGAVVDLVPIPKAEIEKILRNASLEQNCAELQGSWQQLKKLASDADGEDFVEHVSALADWISKVETSAVLSRPPIDALCRQVRTLACLKAISTVYGPENLPAFDQMRDIHASLLAHRLFRIESGGRTNVGIVHAALEEASKNLHLAPKSVESSRIREQSLAEAWDIYSKIYDYLGKNVIGREDGPDGDGPDFGNHEKGLGTINLILSGLFSEGHILFEDFPGTGKSFMAEMLSECIADDIIEVGINIVAYKRIQCVPDLMPSDITGFEALVANRMVFRPGPVFAYFLLLDEINRTTPKVQAALLEAMAEKRVSVGNHRYNLGDVFFVIASQNPHDTVGTYPLPAAQLDRFLFKRRLEPVSQDAVNRIIQMRKLREEGPRIPISRLRAAIKTVGNCVDSNWKDIIPELETIRRVIEGCEKERGELEPGSTPSPRSMQKLGRALQSLAFIKESKNRDPAKAKVHKGLIREIAVDFFDHRIFPSEKLQNQWSQDSTKLTSVHRKEYILGIIDEATARVQSAT
jgi:Mg-chelatase subunit ChlI